MDYRKYISGITLALVLIEAGLWMFTYTQEKMFCDNLLDCGRILFFGSPQQYFSLPTLVILISTIPLFFLKEAVYKTWRNFSLVFIPLLFVFIFTSPEHNSGLFGTTNLFNRESSAFVGSWSYLILSYIIIAVKAWKTRKKAE